VKKYSPLALRERGGLRTSRLHLPQRRHLLIDHLQKRLQEGDRHRADDNALNVDTRIRFFSAHEMEREIESPSEFRNSEPPLSIDIYFPQYYNNSCNRYGLQQVPIISLVARFLIH
jgi:hypothetical protein